MADYGVYIGCAVGISIGSMAVYLLYIYYKTKQVIKS